MIRYLITDGTASRDEARWLRTLCAHMELGVDYIQIRERYLEARHLADLTCKVLAARSGTTRILVNDRADVAMAAGADGVHLRDGSPPPALFSRRGFIVSASCHHSAQVDSLQTADLILLAPVFTPLSKAAEAPPLGLERLREACLRSRVPVLALGGLTNQNAQSCLDAGAAGIAGISLFLEPRPLPR